MISNFKFNLIENFLGYNSTRDKTNLNPGFLIRGSKNMFKKESGTIASRPGLKRRGTADTTLAGVIASTEWETSLGVTIPLRVCNGKLQFESLIADGSTYVWYDLQSSLTLTRYVFDTVWDNTLKKDFLVFVRGDSSLFRWDGGIAKFVSAINNTSITLDRTASTAGFKSTGGTVTINGSTYTYTGLSGVTLTGVTGDASAQAVDSVVYEAVITNTTTPASGFENDFLKVINNQVWIGSYSSRLIYISEDDDYLDYTVPSPRAPGDPELLFLDNNARGIGSIDGEGYVSAGFSDWYRVRFSQITVGSTLTEQTIVDKLELSGKEAALSHEYISTNGAAIIYLSRSQELKALGVFTNQAKTKPVTLSLEIKEELRNQTFNQVQGTTSDGEVRVVGSKIYLTTVSGGLTFIHETREKLNESGEIVSERFWNTPMIWGISRVAVIDGVEYGHSVANPQIYQLWDTEQWYDDSPSDENMPYDCVMRMAYRNGSEFNEENRFTLLFMDMWGIEGYMTQGVKLKGRIYGNYQGSTSLLELVINDTNLSNPNLVKFYTGFNSPSMGDDPLGANPLGEGLTEDELSQEQVPKFRKIKNLSVIQDCFEYSVELYTDEVNSRWEILAQGTNAAPKSINPVFLRG